MKESQCKHRSTRFYSRRRGAAFVRRFERGLIPFIVVAVCVFIPSLFFVRAVVATPEASVINKPHRPARGTLTGIIQTLDVKGGVLKVAPFDGGEIVSFLIDNKLRISSVGGHGLNTAALVPGTIVVVNYEREGARRTVQEITVLFEAPTDIRNIVPKLVSPQPR